MSDHYRTIAAPAEARIKIERSDFLGIAVPVTSDDAFFAELTRVQKHYFDATHHCWAFRLFAESRSRSSDAGEPSGSAGKPILGAIESAGLHDVGVIVVRWFGGVKLGTGGLARAYRECAAATLAATRPLDRFIYTRFLVTAPFDAMSHLYRLVAPPDVVLAEERFGETNEFAFDVRTSKSEAFAKTLTQFRFEWRVAPATE